MRKRGDAERGDAERGDAESGSITVNSTSANLWKPMERFHHRGHRGESTEKHSMLESLQISSVRSVPLWFILVDFKHSWLVLH